MIQGVLDYEVTNLPQLNLLNSEAENSAAMRKIQPNSVILAFRETYRTAKVD